MRLFIAIPCDDYLVKPLQQMQRVWQTLGMRGHATPPGNMHLTLAFIGEYPRPGDVFAALETLPLPSVTLELEGVGSFRDTYWVGIAPDEDLLAYVKRLRRSLAERGIPYDKKRFAPHITLVRRAEFSGSLASLLTQPPVGRTRLREVTLLASTRGKNGMIYTPLGSVTAQ
ncbi:MAG: RNA 2',3'-cyclic phosphodiesterase [Selenomonadaceae bacterium]|nr:RNA 2',3'-cyclic phosphodiesterase [Selenomonadaceae bacterium]